MTEELKLYQVWFSYMTNGKPEDNPRNFEFHAGEDRKDAELNFVLAHKQDMRFIENINVQEVELKTDGYKIILEKIVE